MRPLDELKASPRLQIENEGADGFWAWLVHPAYKANEMSIIASWGGGWEHVSASFRRRCPAWAEMCMLKEIFWRDDECVVQYHPPKSEYVNNHPFCLHLWKRIGHEFETPPSIFVGFKKKGRVDI